MTRRAIFLILSALAVMLLACVLLLPSLDDRPMKAPKNTCINQLHVISLAKKKWASINHKTSGPVTWNDIVPYLRGDPKNTNVFKCPEGGVYTIGNVGELPTCSVKGHEIPAN